MQISIYLLSNCNKLADFQGQLIERFFLCSCCRTFTRTINYKRYLSQNTARGFFLGLSNCSAISYLFFGFSIIFHKLLAQSFDYLVLIFEMTCFFAFTISWFMYFSRTSLPFGSNCTNKLLLAMINPVTR